MRWAEHIACMRAGRFLIGNPERMRTILRPVCRSDVSVK
jgi:hypothetical protein